MKKIRKRKWQTTLLTFVLTGSLLTGCGAANGKSAADVAAPEVAVNSSSSQSYSGGVAEDNYASDAIAREEAAVSDVAESRTQNTDSVMLLEEKLVYHCDLQIETLDYSGTIRSIKDTIAGYDGVIQSENESDSGYNWYYENYRKTSGTMHNYLEIRIPSKNYDSFLAELDGVGKIISKSTSVDNISQQYYDTATQIEALQIQEKNLLGMLEQCETIEDMLTVEERLTEVQYELNRLRTTRRYMDMDVAYSYVNISISEVMEYHQDREPVRSNTFTDRLKNTVKSTGRGFLSFLEGLLFLLIRLLPYILIVGAICLIFRKKIRRFREERKSEREAVRAQKELRRQAVMQQVSAPNAAYSPQQSQNQQQQNQNQQ